MAIPDYQTLMLPVLKAAADGSEHRIRDVIENLADEFHLTEDERRQLLPSGRQGTFDNRVHWARGYLVQAKLLEATQRGRFKITDRGLDVLRAKPYRIDNPFLQQYPEFVEFRRRTPGSIETPLPGDIEIELNSATPDELAPLHDEADRGDTQEGIAGQSNSITICVFRKTHCHAAALDGIRRIARRSMVRCLFQPHRGDGGNSFDVLLSTKTDSGLDRRLYSASKKYATLQTAA